MDEQNTNTNSEKKEATPKSPAGEEKTYAPSSEQEQHFENRIDLQPLADAARQIKEEIGTILVGQNRTLDLLLTAILSDGHVLLEGVPGVAKTLIAKLLSRTISVRFSRIQFTPDLMPSDVIGTTVFNLKDSTFTFRRGPIFSNIVLIDEINRSPAKTQSALFEVMEERQITVDGETHIMDTPFIVIATQNPVEQEGTYQLPEAQRDRFIFKITVDYPSKEEELEIVRQFDKQSVTIDLNKINPVITTAQLEEFRKLIRQIYVDDGLMKYIVDIVYNTRNTPDLVLGASPRASIAILNSSKSYAALNGRDFVTPEDIQFVTPYVLNHRVILSPEKELEGSNSLRVIQDLIKKIEVPR